MVISGTKRDSLKFRGKYYWMGYERYVRETGV